MSASAPALVPVTAPTVPMHVNHLVEPAGVERDDLGVAPDHVERLLHRTRRHRADLAEVLRQDQIGIDGPDPGVIERVDGFARRHAGADLGVDLLRAERSVGGQRRPRHDRHGPGGFGIIAFEADAAQVLTETEGKHDLGGGRQEGDDLHVVIVRSPRPAPR